VCPQDDDVCVCVCVCCVIKRVCVLRNKTKIGVTDERRFWWGERNEVSVDVTLKLGSLANFEGQTQPTTTTTNNNTSENVLETRLTRVTCHGTSFFVRVHCGWCTRRGLYP